MQTIKQKSLKVSTSAWNRFVQYLYEIRRGFWGLHQTLFVMLANSLKLVVQCPAKSCYCLAPNGYTVLLLD